LSFQCRVAGWGKSQAHHTAHNTPREASVKLISRHHCNIAYNGSVHQRAICGDFVGDNVNNVADACNQDSGGTSFIFLKESLIAGIMS